MVVKMNTDPAVFEDDSLALQFVINTMINNKVNTMEVVRVVNVDEANNELTVIPVVKNVDSQGEAIQETNLYKVKFIRWQYGINALMAVPVAGDIGLILVSKRDISKIDTGVVDSRRKFNLADSIYIGGLCGFNATPTQYIKFDENGIEITSPTAINVNAPAINTTSDTATITTTGATTITATGDVNLTGAVVNVKGANINLGEGSLSGVARIGDTVAGGVIVTGSTTVMAG